MDELVTTLGCLASAEERRLFLAALLTPKEVMMIENRLKIFMALLNGRTQRDVRDFAHVGIGTVSHAAKLLNGVDSSILRVVAYRCNIVTPPAVPASAASA